MPRRLGVFWCDRCARAINANDERQHQHSEQCGNCSHFLRVEGTWGYCGNRAAVYCRMILFADDTCARWHGIDASPSPVSDESGMTPPPSGPKCCDRCRRVVERDEREHFHIEQCGGCRKFRRLDADWVIAATIARCMAATSHSSMTLAANGWKASGNLTGYGRDL
jgi:hypothetical protein